LIAGRVSTGDIAETGISGASMVLSMVVDVEQMRWASRRITVVVFE
jgi:hypothetical protein